MAARSAFDIPITLDLVLPRLWAPALGNFMT
jgi:hypothetical protein